MARHNREARGTDQRGTEYVIGYQPDWLRLIKVTRTLDSGRQSTKTLFRNPAAPEQSPGDKVRTRLTAVRGSFDVEVVVHDRDQAVERVTVEAAAPEGSAGASVVFTIVGHRARDTGEDE
jgi:hypothetical protein